MPRNNRGSRNNNPSGRNQYSGFGVMEMARERPVTAAAVAAGTAAAGLFLWSKRTQITDQLSQLSDQISEKFGGSEFGGSEFDEFDDTGGLTSSASTGSRPTGTRGRTSQRGMSETGGGNASLGRQTGGSGIKGNASSRGRARGIPSTT